MIIENLETDIFPHDEIKDCLDWLKTRNYKFVTGYSFSKPKKEETHYKLFFVNNGDVIMMSYYTWWIKIETRCGCTKPEIDLIPKEILASIHKVA